MYSCAKCAGSYNDGAECKSCLKSFDFRCAGISESGYRKLGVDRRAAWKCPDCKLPASPAVKEGGKEDCKLPAPPAAKEGGKEDKIDTILREIRDIKQQLSELPTLTEEIKSVKLEVAELKLSCEYSSAKVDDFEKRMTAMDREFANRKELQADLDATKELLSSLQTEQTSRDQWSRSNNVEIKGVPIKNRENLFTIVENIAKAIDFTFQQSSVNYISRVPMQNSKEKYIIVSFTTRYVKEEFLAAARAKKDFTIDEIGFPDSKQKMYVNDHLIPFYKQLLTKAKTIAKEKNYRYVWVKFGKIHVKKDGEEATRVFIITSAADLNKLV